MQLFGLNQEPLSPKEMQPCFLNQELFFAREMQLFALYSGALPCYRNREFWFKLRRFTSVTLHTASLTYGRSACYIGTVSWSNLRPFI
jgi:hypothetical protein